MRQYQWLRSSFQRTVATASVLAAQANAGPSPELKAMEEGLRAVRESAANAEQRNQVQAPN